MAGRELAAACVVAALVALCAATLSVAAGPPAPRPLPSNYQMITPGRYKRDQQTACDDPKDKKAKCMAKCDKRCPNQCIVLCPGCKTFCSTYFPCYLLAHNNNLLAARSLFFHRSIAN